jgi:hypothetical protein
MQFKTVKGRVRNTFLKKHFNNPIFDIAVFNMADRMLSNYTGGYWEYVQGNFIISDEELGDIPVEFAFLQPERDPTLPKVVCNPISGDEVTVCADLAGMIVTFFAMLLEYERGATHLGDRMENLKDAILQRCSEIDRMDVWSKVMD